MRVLYSIAMYLATPLFLFHLLLRGIRNPAYLKRWGERFALFRAQEKRNGIVVHAVSVGEVNAAAPLIRALMRRFPGRPMTVTTFTPTGSGRVRAQFGDEVFHVYAPFDLPGSVARFFSRVQPSLLVIMETEIWPNLFSEAKRQEIPVLIANARLSERSVQGYRRFRSLSRAALESVSHFAVQSELDAERLVASGANPARVAVSGNIKFDVSLPPSLHEQAAALRRQWGPQRPVLLAGSTHEGEDEAVLEAFAAVLKQQPDALLILVPRHPERFTRVAALARAAGLETEQRSQREACSRDAQCFVIDAMGELVRYYAACDVAFVGGSLVPIGGHNVLEPAALGRPVLVGPQTFNFDEITEQLLAHGGARRVAGPVELGNCVADLFQNPEERDRMGQLALALVETGRGALTRTMAEVEALLDQNATR